MMQVFNHIPSSFSSSPLLTPPSLPPPPPQDERGDVRHPAAVGHRADVRAAARHDETPLAGLPQPGPEGRGPDEEGGGAD